MIDVHTLAPAIVAVLLVLGGCATAPVNRPVTHVDPSSGYRFQARQQYLRNKDDIILLAFSGGGTRAAAFSYGVLETLRDTEIIGHDGHRERLLDSVSIVTGASGGSVKARAYGTYGHPVVRE